MDVDEKAAVVGSCGDVGDVAPVENHREFAVRCNLGVRSLKLNC